MASHTFGLNLGEHYIQLADVEKNKKSFKAQAAAYHPMEFNMYSVTSQDYKAQASQTLRKIVADAGVKKSDVNIVIPDSQSYTRIFDMPLLTDKELISAIRYQADQFIPIPIDQVSLDIQVINKDKENNTTDILLVASSHATIDHIVKIVEDAALIPINIENETSAVLRLITMRNEMKDKEEGSAIYINFGNTSSSLYLFDQKRNLPLQVHNFAIGRDIFFKDIMANFTLQQDQISDLIARVGFTDAQTPYNLHEVLASPFNEFASEIQRFIISSKEQTSMNVKSMYIFGEGAKFAGIDEKIASTINIPVHFFDLHSAMEDNGVKDFFKEDWPLLIPAVGGSLK